MSERGGKAVFLGADPAFLYAFRMPLMIALLDRGWRAVAIAPEQPGFDVRLFQDRGVEFRRWSVVKTALNPFVELLRLAELWRLLARERPQLLFAHTAKAVVYGLIAARLAGVPRRVVMVPGLGYAFRRDGGLKRALVGVAVRIGYRVAMAGAHTAIFQNQDDVETLRRLRVLGPQTQVGIVSGSGVDLKRFSAAAPPDGPPTFLMVCRLLRDKGVYEFVEAARRVRRVLPRARFVLVGAADSNPAAVPESDVDSWVAEGLIEYRGHVADPAPEYAAAHVFVLPSYYMEGCPRVSLEAMASGRAVITTDWVGCRETVVPGETGLIVPPRDEEALAQAMTALGSDLPRCARLGQAGREYCERRFDLEKVCADTVALLLGEQEDTPAKTAPMKQVAA